MAFDSILFPMASDRTRSEIAQAQDFFGDLQLDRIVRSIIADKDEYDLEPFFGRRSTIPTPSPIVTRSCEISRTRASTIA